MTDIEQAAIEQGRRPFSTVEKVIIGVHVVLALGVGFFALLDANDPGWGDLQRLLIFMLEGIWFGAIAGTALVARLVNNPLGRIAILLIGPFSGFLLIMAWAYSSTL
jgi:hypothetical protein